MIIAIPLLGFVLLGAVIFMQYHEIKDLRKRIAEQKKIIEAWERKALMYRGRVSELSAMLHCIKKATNPDAVKNDKKPDNNG